MSNTNTNSISLSSFLQQQQTTSRSTVSNYVNYSSKKQLSKCTTINSTVLSQVLQLTNTFYFSLHTSNKYLVITFYYSKTQKYSFSVLDLEKLTLSSFESVKLCKQYISNQISSQSTNTTK